MTKKVVSENKLKIEYREIPFSTVMDYFVAGFPPDKVQTYEAFYDQHKQKIILKLYIKD